MKKNIYKRKMFSIANGVMSLNLEDEKSNKKGVKFEIYDS